jgi:glc operon protein GlcG
MQWRRWNTNSLLGRNLRQAGMPAAPRGILFATAKQARRTNMKTTNLITALLMGASLVGASDAPVRERKALTLEGARSVIAAAVAQAQTLHAGGAIAVVDEGGNLMALERIDGTFAAGPNISIGKARTAALFQKPTKFFEDVIAKGRTSMVALNDFTPLQGGVPLMMDGQIVGAVGVSGANSAQQDEELAMAGAAALSNAAPPKVSSVTYLESGKVDTAFAKGVPLLEVENYKVHASRREADGMAEVHERDTDIVHVLGGSATLITGGKAVDAKMTAAEEFRGSGIQGGETRTVSKGDVVVIPNGVPHLFRDVKAPLTYYVVKVRSNGGAR